LTGALVRLRKPVVRLREIGLQPRGGPQLLDRFAVSLLIGEQDAELEKALGEAAIERDRTSQQCFHRSQIGGWRGLAFPETHRVVELSQCVSRMRFRETRKAVVDLGAQRRSDAVHLAKELVRARIRWSEIRGLTK